MQHRGRACPPAGERAVQELERPPLERGGRRGRLLLAGELRHERRRERGPAGELGLERRHGGDRLRRGADPQDVGFVIVFNGRVEDLCEEGGQGVIPADDDREARVLCGDADSDSYTPPLVVDGGGRWR